MPAGMDHLAATALNEMPNSNAVDPFSASFLDFPLGDDQEFW
jgi:hypothetical protein